MEMASKGAVSQFNNLIKHFNDFLGLMTTSAKKGNARRSRIKNLKYLILTAGHKKASHEVCENPISVYSLISMAPVSP